MIESPHLGQEFQSSFSIKRGHKVCAPKSYQGLNHSAKTTPYMRKKKKKGHANLTFNPS